MDRADLIGDPDGPETTNKWFNTDTFELGAPGTFGTSGRNMLTGPGTKNVDFSVFKKFAMPYAEGHALEFRAEFFNLFNHPNYGLPDSSLSDSIFGQIVSASDPRIIQAALRYSF
jgi:hypothetical protein